MRMIEVKVETNRAGHPRSVWYNVDRIVAVSKLDDDDETFVDVDGGGRETITVRTLETVESLILRLKASKTMEMLHRAYEALLGARLVLNRAGSHLRGELRATATLPEVEASIEELDAYLRARAD